MEEGFAARCLDKARSLAALCEIAVGLVTSDPPAFIGAGALCERCGACKPVNTHLYGASEAMRWNGRYIYYCPAGLAFVAAALTAPDGGLEGALIAGPLLMGEPFDALSGVEPSAAAFAAIDLPALAPARVTALSEIMATCVRALALAAPLRERAQEDGAGNGQQEGALAAQLAQCIARGDKMRAQRLLNDALGSVYFAGDAGLVSLRQRASTLSTQLAQAAERAGLYSWRAQGRDAETRLRLSQCRMIEEVDEQLSLLARAFIQTAFDFAPARHADAVYKAIGYIREHISEKLTLGEIAGSAHLSRTYLSSLFKQQTGKGLFAYITHLRIEKSRVCLAETEMALSEVAQACGFEDQSYFNNVFKRETGMSPGAYRRQALGESSFARHIVK